MWALPSHKERKRGPGSSLILTTAAALIAVFLLWPACRSSRVPEDRVTLQLKWHHQAQFAGFYVAEENGFYKKENLSVDFIEGGNDVALADALVEGKADFAVLSPETLLEKRSIGIPVIAIAAIYRKSAVVFVSKKGSGIIRPGDFYGKTIAAGTDNGGSSEFVLQLRTTIKNQGIDLSGIKVVPYDPSYSGFYKGDADVTAAYYTGGVIRMRQKGLDINLIWPCDYGVHFYSDILAVSEDILETDPQLVERFLRASLQGWRKAIGNPEQTVDATLPYARIKDAKLQSAMLEAMLPLVHTGQGHIGSMEPSVWQGMYSAMQENGLLTDAFDIRQAYSLEFLQKLHPETAK